MPAASHISFKDYKYIPMLLIHSEVCCIAGDRPMASAVQKGGREGGGGDNGRNNKGESTFNALKMIIYAIRLCTF